MSILIYCFFLSKSNGVSVWWSLGFSRFVWYELTRAVLLFRFLQFSCADYTFFARTWSYNRFCGLCATQLLSDLPKGVTFFIVESLTPVLWGHCLSKNMYTELMGFPVFRLSAKIGSTDPPQTPISLEIPLGRRVCFGRFHIWPLMSIDVVSGCPTQQIRGGMGTTPPERQGCYPKFILRLQYLDHWWPSPFSFLIFFCIYWESLLINCIFWYFMALIS